MSVTIRDVAKYCGVSVSTVSRVLNGYTDISEETANRVFEAIKKLDFVPNNTARMLSKKNTRIIGLTIPDIKDPFFSENAAGAERLLQENGYEIFYGNMERSSEKLMNFLQQDLKQKGYRKAIVGVEPKEKRNREMYHHWGFTEHVFSGTETYPDGTVIQVDFFGKKL